MANQPLGGFIWGQGGAQLTPEQISLRRALNQRKMGQGADTSPVGHWSAGLARVTDAIGDVLENKRLNTAQGENDTYNSSLLDQIMGGGSSPAASQGAAMPAPGASAEMVTPSQTLAGAGDIVQGVMDASAPASAAPSDGTSWLQYANQGATRSQPLNEKLVAALGRVAPELGIGVQVFSGGQPAAGEGPRTGSTRHDHGNAADVFFTKDGRKLDWANPNDQPIFQEIVKRSRAAGITGIGAGDGYMQPGSMHIGFGKPAVWGAGGQGSNAPEWLRSAFNSPVTPQSQQAIQRQLTPDQVASGNAMAAIPLAAQQVGGPNAMPAGLRPDPNETASTAPPLSPPRTVGALPAVEQVAQAMPQQAAPQPQGINPALIKAISDPRANPQTKQIAQILIQQQQQRAAQQAEQQQWLARQQYETQQKQNDPAYQLGLQKTQAELDEMRNPRVKPTSDIQEYEYAKQQGFNGSFAQFQADMKRAGANNTTINNGEGNKFYNTLDEANAKTFSSLSEQGMAGRSKMAQIDRLEGLMANAPQGAVGALKQAAGEYGIPTEGLSDIQAATALIGQLVPQQRAPGSGTVSDADLALFKQSLPRLINQPGGNQAIIQTMRGLTDYQIKMGEIADRVANRERKEDGTIYTPADARKDIATLPNPLAAFKPPEGQSTPNEGWQEITPGVRVRKVN